MIKIIDMLNTKLNYNDEVFILFIILSGIFAVTSRLVINGSIMVSLVFGLMAVFCFGLSAGFYIYHRDDNMYYGYEFRHSVRSIFRK